MGVDVPGKVIGRNLAASFATEWRMSRDEADGREPDRVLDEMRRRVPYPGECRGTGRSMDVLKHLIRSGGEYGYALHAGDCFFAAGSAVAALCTRDLAGVMCFGYGQRPLRMVMGRVRNGRLTDLPCGIGFDATLAFFDWEVVSDEEVQPPPEWDCNWPRWRRVELGPRPGWVCLEVYTPVELAQDDQRQIVAGPGLMESLRFRGGMGECFAGKVPGIWSTAEGLVRGPAWLNGPETDWCVGSVRMLSEVSDGTDGSGSGLPPPPSYSFSLPPPLYSFSPPGGGTSKKAQGVEPPE